MKKREIVNILKPYWMEYLRKNGEFERSLQLGKFVDETKRLKKFNISKIFYLKDYLNFIVSLYLIRKKFWKLSQVIAKLKKRELELFAFKIKYQDTLSKSNLEEAEAGLKIFRRGFRKLLKEYLKNTLGSADREMRLWCAYEILIKNKPT